MAIDTNDPDRSIYESQEAAEAAKSLGQQLKETAKAVVGLGEATGRTLSVEEQRGKAWIDLKENTANLSKTFASVSVGSAKSVGTLDDMTSVGSAFGGIVGNVASTVLPKFAGAIGVAGKMIGVLYKAISEQVEAQYSSSMSLAQSGVTFKNFNKDLVHLSASAALGSADLAQLNAIVAQNAYTFSILGGNVTDGAKVFANLVDPLQTSTELLRMGFGIPEINEATGTYLTLLTRSNRQELMKTIREGRFQGDFEKYARNLREVSALTGAQADEQRKAQEELQNDTRFRAYIREMQLTDQKGLAKEMEALYGGLKELDPDFASGLADLVATQGKPISDAGQKVFRALGGSADAMALLNNSLLSPTEKIQQFGAMLKETRDANTGLARLAPEAFEAAYGNFVGMDQIVLTLSADLQKLNENVKVAGTGGDAQKMLKGKIDLVEAQRNSAKALAELSGYVLSFNASIASIKRNITDFGVALAKIINKIGKWIGMDNPDDVTYGSDGGGGPPGTGRRQGTLRTDGELFPDFGPGTPTTLHGREAVVPRASMYGQILSAIDDGNLIKQLSRQNSGIGPDDEVDPILTQNLTPNIQQNRNQSILNEEAVDLLRIADQENNIQTRLLKEINGNLTNIHGSLS